MLVCACVCAHKVIVLVVVIVIICANVCINAGYYIISVHHMIPLLHTTSFPRVLCIRMRSVRAHPHMEDSCSTPQH